MHCMVFLQSKGPAAMTEPSLKIDAAAWHAGHLAGRRGLAVRHCPYSAGTVESWSWVSAFIEGKAEWLRQSDRPVLQSIADMP